MQYKQYIPDDDAVSPVIGVILMVAITVILAAVIASFVLGLGDEAGQTAPQVSVECSNSNMIHQGGDSLPDDSSILSVTGSGASLGSPSSGSSFTAGDTIATGVSSGSQLIWSDPDSGDSQILAEC